MKLNQEQIKDITNAVAEAEKQTNGEIVVCLVKRSIGASQALWKAFVFGLLSGLLVYRHPTISGWFDDLPGSEYLFLFGLSILLLLLAQFVPIIQKLFLGQKEVESAVQHRALRAFLEEEVFKTKERTGILVFVSLFEQKVLVLGDSGINAVVETSQWDQIIQIILNGIKTRSLAKGLSDAVIECGQLLKNSGLTIGPDDKNELANQLRYFDE